jgi:hypothetical protein
MKVHPITIILAATLLGGVVDGQEIKTDRVRFNLKNISVVPEGQEHTGDKPVIEVISPAKNGDGLFRSSQPDIDLIGQVTAASGVSFVTVNSKMAEVNEKGMFTHSLRLDPGENQIKLVAGDAEKNLTEEVITIEYTPPVVTLAERIAGQSKYFGLIIGIENYMDENIPDLNNPIRDAEKVYNVLITHYTFDPENIHMLRDATRDDLIRVLDELSHEVTSDDNLLIFYAGHGWWDEEANNGYWLPADADSRVKTNWFRNSALVDYLKEINSRHTLLIADACFGGSIFRTRAAFPSREKAYEKLYELPSRKAMTSGTLTEVPDRSSFTRFLVERLNENMDTYISSEQLFSSFRIAVINNSDAIPQYGEIGNVGDQGGDFIFIRRKQ